MVGTSKVCECQHLCFSGEPAVKAFSAHAWVEGTLLSRLPGERSKTPAPESLQSEQLSTGSCLSVQSSALVIQSCLFATPWTRPARLLCPWNSLGKNTGVGNCSLLQEISSTQGLLHRRRILYPLSYQRSAQ